MSRPIAWWVLAGICAALPAAARADTASCPADGAKRRIIVTIGIDNYENWEHLKSPVRDADDVEAMFVTKFGFVPYAQIMGKERLAALSLKNPNKPPFRDENATKDAIETLEDQLGDFLCENDDLVFYYSGHGDYSKDPLHEDDANRWEGYLIPVDAPVKEKHQWNRLIRLSTLLDSLSRVRARHVLVILDACHSGMAIPAGSLVVHKSGAMEFANDQKFMEAMSKLPSRQIVTATAGNQLAGDDGPGGHSLFTGVFLQELEDEVQARKHSYIDPTTFAAELKKRVTEAAPDQTSASGQFTNDEGGELILPLDASFDKQCMDAEAYLALGEVDSFDVNVTRIGTSRPDDEMTLFLKYRKAIEEQKPQEAEAMIERLRAADPDRLPHQLKPRDLTKILWQIDFWKEGMQIPPTPMSQSPIKIKLLSVDDKSGATTGLAGVDTFQVDAGSGLQFKAMGDLGNAYIYGFMIDRNGVIAGADDLFNDREVATKGEKESLQQDGLDSGDMQEWHFLISSEPIEGYGKAPNTGRRPPVSLTPEQLKTMEHLVIRVASGIREPAGS